MRVELVDNRIRGRGIIRDFHFLSFLRLLSEELAVVKLSRIKGVTSWTFQPAHHDKPAVRSMA
jgi:hypothetical protein